MLNVVTSGHIEARAGDGPTGADGRACAQLGSLIGTGSLTEGKPISRMFASENTMQSFTGTTRI